MIYKQRNIRGSFLNLHGRKAFTFIEIILVVIILLVISAVAIPNFSGTFRYYQAQTVAKNMAHLMRYAQSRAITHNSFLKLDIRAADRYYQLLEADYGDGLIEGVDFSVLQNRFGRKYAIPAEIEITASAEEIFFYPDGEISKVRVSLCQGEVCKWLSTQEQRGHVWILDYTKQ